jgi:hypothetical protein
MGLRVSESIKIAPGVRVRLNSKSTSVTLGGKGARYTVSSKGRRTTTVSVPVTGVPAPLSRDLAGMLLVQLHIAAGHLDWAESAVPLRP